MGCKEIGVIKVELVAKTQFVFKKMLCIILYFSSLDAEVACRWLGFQGGLPRNESYYGLESYYTMDDVECTGALSSKHVEIFL